MICQGSIASDRVLRFTRNHDRLRDGHGVRWRFSAARIRWCGAPSPARSVLPARRADNRVSVARADAGASPAVLLTFSVEMRSAVRTELQRIIAVLLPAQGDAVEVNEPERWLQLAAPDRSLLTGDVWQTLFAQWVPNRQRRSRRRSQVPRCSATPSGSRRIISRKPSAKRATCKTGCAGARMTSAVHSCRRRATCLARPRSVRIGDCCPHRLSVWRPSRPTPTIHRHDVARRTVPSSCSAAAALDACGVVSAGSASDRHAHAGAVGASA